MTSIPEGKTQRQHSAETKEKIGNSRRGQKMPADAVAKMTDRVRANPPRPMLGKTHSPEAKEKMRLARLNRVVDPVKEAKRIEALRAAVKGKPKSKEHRNKIRQSVLHSIAQGGQPTMTSMNTQGERAIADYLAAQNLSFKQQYLVANHLFDFFVPSLNLLIEFDGAHHWKAPWFEKDTSKHPKLLAEQILKDVRQTAAAENLGYRVARVLGVNTVGDSHHGSLETQLIRQRCQDLVNYQSPYVKIVDAFTGNNDPVKKLMDQVTRRNDPMQKLVDSILGRKVI